MKNIIETVQYLNKKFPNTELIIEDHLDSIPNLVLYTKFRDGNDPHELERIYLNNKLTIDELILEKCNLNFGRHYVISSLYKDYYTFSDSELDINYFHRFFILDNSERIFIEYDDRGNRVEINIYDSLQIKRHGRIIREYALPNLCKSYNCIEEALIFIYSVMINITDIV